MTVRANPPVDADLIPENVRNWVNIYGVEGSFQPTPSIDYIEITVETMATNQTVTVNKYFTNFHSINWGDGATITQLTATTTHTYTTIGTYKIILSLPHWERWRFWTATNIPLVQKASTTASNVYISKMPSLAGYFGDSATTPWNNFFLAFNYNWALTSLPEGSFDTSYLTTIGNDIFRNFNYQWMLTSLPEGSFNTSNITTIGTAFFSGFNSNGNIITIPDSFQRPALNLTQVNQLWVFNNSFSSTYTLTRDASFIIRGVTTPTSNRLTFSSNQPWYSTLPSVWRS
jgi:hypothetical protein